MIEPIEIEHEIAGFKLPEPSRDLDRRIDELLAFQKCARAPSQSQGARLFALTAGSVGLALLGLVLSGTPTPQRVAESRQGNEATVVGSFETIEVSIPSLDLPAGSKWNDQDRLLPPGTIVVFTSTQKKEDE
jgi:hypothetical protein